MSYILEALEKSENERQQQAVPDLQTQHTLYPGAQRSKSHRPKSRTRRFRPAVLAGLLMLPALWLFRDQIPVALEIKITRQSELSTSPRPATTPDRENGLDPAGKTASDQPPAPASTESAQEKTVPQPALSAATTETPSAHSEEQTEGINTQPPAQTAGQISQTVSTQKTVTLQPAPLLATGSAEPEAIPPLQALPYMEELPASVRDALPRLKFAGHTYSADAKNRMIIINNTIRKEGDPVGQGLKLEEITWDGVILNSRGVRFQMITTTN